MFLKKTCVVSQSVVGEQINLLHIMLHYVMLAGDKRCRRVTKCPNLCLLVVMFKLYFNHLAKKVRINKCRC